MTLDISEDRQTDTRERGTAKSTSGKPKFYPGILHCRLEINMIVLLLKKNKN
jgi:hypothetical protein